MNLCVRMKEMFNEGEGNERQEGIEGVSETL